MIRKVSPLKRAPDKEAAIGTAGRDSIPSLGEHEGLDSRGFRFLVPIQEAICHDVPEVETSVMSMSGNQVSTVW